MAQSYTVPGQQVPPEVYNQAATYSLGNVTGTYKPRFTNLFVILGIGIGATILDIIVLYAILVASGYLFYILIVIPILALIWMFTTLPYANLRVYTFSQGIVHAKGNALEVVRWDQIEAVWERLIRSRGRTQSVLYTVRRGGDGKTFTYGSQLQQNTVLGQTIQQEVVRIQLPRAIPAFQAGQNIAFGPVNANQQGLNNGREMVPWNQVGSIIVREGIICIEQGGRLIRWNAVKSSTVPNLAVLQALVNYVVNGPRQ